MVADPLPHADDAEASRFLWRCGIETETIVRDPQTQVSVTPQTDHDGLCMSMAGGIRNGFAHNTEKILAHLGFDLDVGLEIHAHSDLHATCDLLDVTRECRIEWLVGCPRENRDRTARFVQRTF